MVGMILKNMRLKAKLSQKQLGKMLNLADTTISSYERENSQATFDVIIRIAEICGYEFKIVDIKNNVTNLEEWNKEMDF